MEKFLWCPTCEESVPPGPEMVLQFRLQGVELELDGALDVEGSCFMIYTHMVCNTRVNLSRLLTWDAGLMEYAPTLQMVEVDNDSIDLHVHFGDDYEPVWLQSYSAMSELFEEALAKLLARS